MGKVRSEPLSSVSFRCVVCSHEWTGAPGEVLEAPGDWWHPWTYSADCPVCGGDGQQQPAERGRLKAWAHATGPTSEEGRARSAANLVGHPTPEEARVTRLNAIKHGQYARAASFFPARPGKYPHCRDCRYYGQECVENPPAHHNNPAGCLLRTELFMRHQIAFESQDPQMLTDIRAGTQAAIQGLIDDMIAAIAADGGPEINEVQWYYDKNGGFHLAEYTDEDGKKRPLYELKAHPLLKPLIEFTQKNAMTLADMGMTPKVRDEAEMVQGYLDQEGDKAESLEDYRQQILEKQQQLLELIRGGQGQNARVIDGERVESGSDG